MTKLSELTKLFQEFDGDLKDQFIKKYPEIWNDCYDIMEGSRYHNVMLGCLKAGFDAATPIFIEREKVLMGVIDKMKSCMNRYSHEGITTNMNNTIEEVSKMMESL